MISRTTFREIESAHRMAWCARVDDSGTTTVLHGPWVETFSGGFVEGAWSGQYSQYEFFDADMFLGSGGRNLSQEPQFSTATHPFEPLYSLNEDQQFFVSNSLSFLCAVTDAAPNPDYPFYVNDLISFMKGISRAESHIELDQGRRVRLHYCSTLKIKNNSTLEEQRHPPLGEVITFQEYRKFLSEASKTIVRNARAVDRDHTFRPIATISSGYDSPATAVFAREAGASRALSFEAARDVFGEGKDTGAQVARHLGLEVTEFDRLQYRKRMDCPEADFLAAGTGGEDVVFASFEEELPSTILFTGFLGDTLWSRHHQDPSRSLEFVMTHPAGASIQEFRLRTGFIHFPMPLTTYTMHPSLHQISNSPEMEPWSVADDRELSLDALLGRTGPGYDRPIARRIVEEEGVPRQLFGQKKRAVSQPFYHDEDLGEIMSGQSLEDFRTFLRMADLPPSGFTSLLHRLTSTLYRMLDVPVKLVRKLSLYLGRPVDVTLPWPHRYRESLSEHLYTFHWAVEKVRNRYEKALPWNIEEDDSCD